MQDATLAHDTKARLDAADIDAEYTRIDREHRELKARLSELNSRPYLSAQEQIERKTIQKLKLAKKDRLAQLEALRR